MRNHPALREKARRVSVKHQKRGNVRGRYATVFSQQTLSPAQGDGEQGGGDQAGRVEERLERLE